MTPSSSPIPVPSSPVFSTPSTSHTSTASLEQTDSTNLEDIFTSQPTVQHPSDSPRLRAIHVTAGYRDGASGAREAAVQGGFDEGFLLGAAIGARVGLLIGIIGGVAGAKGSGDEDGDGSLGSTEVQAKARKLLERMRKDLALENVLGPRFVLADGMWGWDVSAEQVESGGIDAVAEAHPLVRRYASVVGRWVRALDLRRLGEGVGEGG